MPELTDQQFNENIQSTTAEIEKIIGVKPDLFRPPFGEIEDRQVEMLNKQGYRSICGRPIQRTGAECLLKKLYQE
ncbi:polysaccharide deacetylase family protein [Alteribacillus bidgolensis]|uniref:polysaccharide deacetylase family protein n=1 Tax=Alteribacillus bidgolensis TaxID=930129 RepID=UPI0014741DC8|nr:polysaccharide deacetylase family protein [Alteribacillus bidgolensis]